MRARVVTLILKIIWKECPEYTEDQMAVVKYGLESIYILITKMIVLTLAATMMGIIKEFLIFLIFFGIIRSTAFGLHANKSWECYVSSFLLLVLPPWICLQFEMKFWIQLILGTFAIGYIYKYAPADTKNRPIVSQKRRKVYKIISTLTACLYVIASFYTPRFYANSLIAVLLIECLMISPGIYSFFHLPYANYRQYLKHVS